MQITLANAKDKWSQASLAGTLAASEPSHILIYAIFKNDVWWAKSSLAINDIALTAFYHHVHDKDKRQVLVTCGSTSIDHCVIPTGYDPVQSCTAEINPLVPSPYYSCREHVLGVILIPKSATRSLRNTIWRIKESLVSDELIPFSDALAHGKRGKSTQQTWKLV